MGDVASPERLARQPTQGRLFQTRCRREFAGKFSGLEQPRSSGFR
jgi:hypothetical protein